MSEELDAAVKHLANLKPCTCQECKEISALRKKLLIATNSLKLAEKYLVERGIENRGTIGRTIVLPSIRSAICEIGEEK